MPGYDRTRIVGVSKDDLEEFICGICLEVFIKPTVTECCGQTYCFDCITEWLAVNNSCPNDRKTLSTNQLKSAPKMVSNLLSNMKIKCDFVENGCQSVVRINNLDKHRFNECVFNPDRKCQKCDLALMNHNDQICNQELFRKYTNVSTILESLRIEHDQTLVKREVEIVENRSYINELLNKIKNLDTKYNEIERKFVELKRSNIELEAKMKDTSHKPNIATESNVLRMIGKSRDDFNKIIRANIPENRAKTELIQKFRDQGIISVEVAIALKLVDRANYCPNDPYADKPQHIGFGVNISAPHMHARVLELMSDKLVKGAKALDIGSGSGYLTACMAYMVAPNGRVFGIDKVKQVVDISIANIRLDYPSLLDMSVIQMHVGDGRYGYPKGAPYDVIHVGAASPTLPQTLMDQLKRGGRMIIPIGDTKNQQLEQIDKNDDGTITRTKLMGVLFQSLTG